MLCKFCGKEIPNVSKRGRPRCYCSVRCQRKYEYRQRRKSILADMKQKYYDNHEEYLQRAKYFRDAKGKNLKSDKIMSDLERGYVAGLFDGEGTIGMIVEGRKENACGIRFSPNVVIYNTNVALLSRAREAMGNGAIYSHDSGRNGHKRSYALRLTANQIRHVLPQITGVLVAKREQAELLLAYLELAESGVRTAHLYERFVDIYWRLSILNARGKVTYFPRASIENKLQSIAERAS